MILLPEEIREFTGSTGMSLCQTALTGRKMNSVSRGGKDKASGTFVEGCSNGFESSDSFGEVSWTNLFTTTVKDIQTPRR